MARYCLINLCPSGVRPAPPQRTAETGVAFLMGLICEDVTFEPVSAKTQPVFGPAHWLISDIEISWNGDSSRKMRLAARNVGFSSPETLPLPANPREPRHFSEYR